MFTSEPGAKLVGDAKIGSNVTIAANSLVLTDVRDNMMVMGVPARIKLPGGRPQRFVKKTAPAAVPAKPRLLRPSAQRQLGSSINSNTEQLPRFCTLNKAQGYLGQIDTEEREDLGLCME